MKKFFKAIILTVTVLMSLTSVSASIKVPERTSDTTWVEDYANVLTGETEAYIQKQSQILADNYSAFIMVVTVDFVTGSIDDYALAIFNQWKLGDSSLNNGVLLLLSIGDEDYYMMIGRGLEDDFPIYDIQQLLDNYLEPSFAAKDYDGGVRKLYEKTYQYMDENIYGNIPNNNNNNNNNNHGGTYYTYNWFMLLFELIIIICLVIMIYRIVTRATRKYYQPTYYYTRPRYRTYTSPFTYTPSTYYSYDHYSTPSSHKPSGGGGSSYHGGGGYSGGGGSSHSSGGSSHSFGSGSSHGGSSRGAGAGRH